MVFFEYIIIIIILGEPGEFVGKIIVTDPLRQFDGYVNQSATKKKIVRDCFQKGDMAFLSGIHQEINYFSFDFN